MALAHVGNLGTALSSANNQASLVLTTTAQALAGSLVVLLIAVDNVQTTDGDSTAVSGVVDSAGNTYQRAKGFANGQAAAQAGADISIWFPDGGKLATTLPSGGTITATFANAALADASAMTAKNFSMTAGNIAAVEGTPGGLAADGAAVGSLNVTTANIECLRVRGIASESNSSTALTPTATWAIFAQAISGAGTTATEMGVRGEWLISTATGAASNPTGGAGNVDHASAYVAFKESAPPPIVGTLTKTLANLTLVATGVGPPVYTLDPAKKHADITLSNGNLTATNTILGTPDFKSVKSTVGLTEDGTYVFKLTGMANGNNETGVALGNASALLGGGWTTGAIGSDANSCAVFIESGDLYYNAASPGAFADIGFADRFWAVVLAPTTVQWKHSADGSNWTTAPATLTRPAGAELFLMLQFQPVNDTATVDFAPTGWTLAGAENWQPASGGTGVVVQTLAPLTVNATGALPIVGAVSKTLANITLVSTGALPVVGTLNKTLDAVTLVAAGGQPLSPIVGTLSKTLDALTLTASGKAESHGTVDKTLANLAAASQARLAIAATAATQLAALTVEATGKLEVKGSTSQTLQPLGAVVAGKLALVGSLSSSLQALQASAAGRLAITSQAAIQLAPLTCVATAKLAIAGALGKTLANVTLDAFSGAPPPIEGSLVHTLANLQAVALGRLAIVAQSTTQLATLTVQATGSLTVKGSTSQTLQPLVAAATGRLAITAAVAKQLAPVTLVATGHLAQDGSGDVAVTLQPLLVTGAARLALAGVVAKTLEPLTAAAMGEGPGAITGTLARTLAPLSSQSSGASPIVGTLAQTLAPLTVHFTFSRPTKRISITAQKSLTPAIIAQRSTASIVAQRTASSSWDAQS